MSNRWIRLSVWALMGCVVSALAAVCMLLLRPVWVAYPAPGTSWSMVPLSLPVLTGVAALTLLCAMLALPGHAAAPRFRVRLLVATAPVVLWLLWYAPVLAPIPRAFVTFYVPLFWLVTLAFHGLERDGAGAPALLSRRDLRVVGLGAALFYTATGVYYTTQCGPHAGDEGYYLIQVESLYRDGDTDIRNDLGKKISNHISPFTRLPHYYSYHPPGLPFLLTPVYPLGVWGRHAVIGSIAALGLLAVLGLCRGLGVPRFPAVLLVLLQGLSVYWVVYSSRCLPEMMGASLVACVFWASAAQKKHPWASAVLAAVGTAYLPLASIRFTPVMAGCALFYVGAAWLDPRPWREKIRALALWLLLLVAGVALMHAYQCSRFIGGFSHPVGDMLFSNPKGAWLALADYKGITNVYPAYLWLLAANVLWLVRAPATRWYALGALLLFAGVLITSTMVSDWKGGSTLGGRFLVVTMAVLLPGAAWAWRQTTPAARWALLMLAGVSIGLLVWQLFLLPGLGGNFGRPWGELLEVAPGLVGIRCFLARPVMLIGLALGVAALVWMPAAWTRRGWSVLALLLAWCALNHAQAEPIKLVAPYYHDYKTSPSWMAEKLRLLDLQRYAWSRRAPCDPAELFSVSDRFFSSSMPNALPSVFTRAPATPPLEAVDLSAQAINDWQQRPLRWATLKSPFDAGRGDRVFHVRGRVEGEAKAVIAVVEGNRTLLETTLPVGTDGAVELLTNVTCRGRGHTYLLLRLEGGEGAFVDGRIAWSPFRGALFSSAGLKVEGLK